jgi:hypothetical protein
MPGQRFARIVMVVVVIVVIFGLVLSAVLAPAAL